MTTHPAAGRSAPRAMATARAHLWRRQLTRAAVCVLLGVVTTAGVAVVAVVRPLRMPKTQWTEAGFIAGEQQWVFAVGQRWDATAINVSFSPRLAKASPFGREEAGPKLLPFMPRRGRAAHALYGAVNATMKQAPIDDFRETAFFAWLDAPWVDVPTPPEFTEETSRLVGIHYGGLAVGWPCRAAWLSCCIKIDTRDDGELSATVLRKGWWINERTAIPTNILPLGFAVNTGAFAAAWWVLLTIPGAVKRWRRKRRGACVACGYDLRGLGEGAACPECGT